MAMPFVQDKPDEASYTNLIDKLPTSTWDQVQTSFKDEFNQAATAKIMDVLETDRLSQIPGQKDLSVEELNQKYEGLGIAWDSPKKERVAEYIAENRREKIYNQNKIDAGPDGYLNYGLRGGAAVLAHVVDPTEAALTIATGGVLRAGMAARFGAQSIAQMGLLGRVGLGAIEGAATQAVLEPVNALHAREMVEDYDSLTLLQNIAMGTVAGAATEGLLYGGSKLLQKMRRTRASTVAQDAAIGQLLEGKKVDVDPIIRDFEAERAGVRPEGLTDYSGRSEYQFKPFDSKSPGGTKVYLGSSSALEKFSMMDRSQFGVEGFVDNPLLANADAASKHNDAVGNIHSLELSPDARIISTKDAIGDGEKNMILSALNENEALASVASDLKNVEINSIDDVLRVARENGVDEDQVLRALEPGLDKAGFDGFHIEGEQGNRFDFFENALKGNREDQGRKLFQKTEAFKGDERLMGGLSADEQARYRERSLSQEAKDGPTREMIQEFDELAELGSRSDDELASEFDEIIKEVDSSMKELEGIEGALDPDVVKEIETIQQIDKLASDGEGMIKAAFKCVMGNG